MANRRTFLQGSLAAAAAGSLGIAWTPARAADEIVVGATVPMTGAQAGSGVQYYNSLRMAEADINSAGGINGRPLRIAFEDTQASNSVAVNAFVKLSHQVEPCFIFLSSLTVQNLAVEQAVAKAEIPSVYAGGGVAIADKGNPWMFRIRPPDNLAAENIGRALAGVLKAQNIGIIHVHDDYGTGSANSLEASAQAAGLNVVARETYSSGDNDFSPQLLSMKGKGVDAMMVVAYPRDGALLLTQRRRLDISIPIIGNVGFVHPALVDLVSAEDLNGVYSMIDALLGDSISPESGSYSARYLKQFQLKADPFGSCYYDAAMILADALRTVGPDRAKIREYFASVKDYKGVTRSYSTDARNDMAHDVALVKYSPNSKDTTLVGYYPADPASATGTK